MTIKMYLFSIFATYFLSTIVDCAILLDPCIQLILDTVSVFNVLNDYTRGERSAQLLAFKR